MTRPRTAESHRQRILAVAMDEFARRGYHGATVADIARAAGISEAYVFALFTTKRGLFRAVYDRAAERTRVVLDEAAALRARAAGRGDDAAARHLAAGPALRVQLHAALDHGDRELRSAAARELAHLWARHPDRLITELFADALGVALELDALLPA